MTSPEAGAASEMSPTPHPAPLLLSLRAIKKASGGLVTVTLDWH
jgi:hypothetical protein